MERKGMTIKLGKRIPGHLIPEAWVISFSMRNKSTAVNGYNLHNKSTFSLKYFTLFCVFFTTKDMEALQLPQFQDLLTSLGSSPLVQCVFL